MDAARAEASRLGPAATDAERNAVRQSQSDADQRLREATARLDRARREIFAQQLLAAGARWPTDPDGASMLLREESRCPPDLRDFTWNMLDAACARPRLKLDGPAEGTRVVVSSPDGKTLAVAGDDGIVRLFNAETRQSKQELTRHRGAVHAVAFDPKGKLIATAGADRSIHLWDAAGKHVRTLTGHKKAIYALAFAPNGKLLASAGDESTIRIWDAHADKELGEIKKAHVGTIRALAFDPNRDGKVLASAGDDAIIKFWDEKKATMLTRAEGHRGQIYALAYSPNGRLLASAGIDKEPMVWDVATGAVKLILTGHTGPVAALAFSSDGKTLASAAEEASGVKDRPAGSVHLWDATSGRSLAFYSNPAPLASVAFVCDNKQFAVATGASAEIWQTACPPELRTVALATGPLQAVALAPDGETLAGGQDSLIKLIDPSTGSFRESLKGHTGAVTALAYRGDGKLLASGSADGSLRLWDAEGKSSAETAAHAGGVTCLAFARDGTRLVSAGKDRLVKIWGQAVDRPSAVLLGHSGAEITCLAVAPDGRLIASADSAGALILWKSSGEKLRDLATTGEPIQALTFTPDGATLVSGYADGTVMLWGVEAGKVAQKLTGQRGAVTCLAVSPDGKTLAVGAGEVRLWDPVAGQLRAILPGHGKPIVALGFTLDNRRLISAGVDGTIKVWGTASQNKQ